MSLICYFLPSKLSVILWRHPDKRMMIQTKKQYKLTIVGGKPILALNLTEKSFSYNEGDYQ